MTKWCRTSALTSPTDGQHDDGVGETGDDAGHDCDPAQIKANDIPEGAGDADRGNQAADAEDEAEQASPSRPRDDADGLSPRRRGRPESTVRPKTSRRRSSCRPAQPSPTMLKPVATRMSVRPAAGVRLAACARPSSSPVRPGFTHPDALIVLMFRKTRVTYVGSASHSEMPTGGGVKSPQGGGHSTPCYPTRDVHESGEFGKPDRT